MTATARTAVEALLLMALAVPPAVVLHAGLPGGGGPVGTETPTEVLAADEVAVETARSWGEAVLWIDARPADAYAEKHIDGALPLNEDAWDDQLFPVLDALTPGVPVVVYCSSSRCDASRAVADRLRATAGIAEVYVLHGGWEAWRAREAATP